MIKRFVPLLGLGAIAACASGTANRRGTVVRDSAGIRIVENTTPLWQEGEGWHLSPEPVVDIGGGDAEENQLFRVTGATRHGPPQPHPQKLCFPPPPKSWG